MKLDWALEGHERPPPEPSSGIDLMAGQRTAYAFSKDFQLWLVCSYLCGFPFPLES